jgi:hypothetical protein
MFKGISPSYAHWSIDMKNVSRRNEYVLTICEGIYQNKSITLPSACYMLQAVFCLAYSPTLKMEATFPPKCRFTFNELQGAISQKLELLACCSLDALLFALP